MRKLNPDERRLWDFVTRSVTPLKGRHHSADEPAPIDEPPAKPKATHIPVDRLFSTPSPKKEHTPAPKRLHIGTAVDLDAATARKFKRGKMPCDAKLDLHGLTLAQAHSGLISFIRSQSERGARSVIVITGKGSPNSERPTGKIKSELIHWLNAAPLRPLILAVNEAAPRQGGSGAVYVLLKRKDRLRS
ncbi:MAG: Smr/MutS family protein [Rhodospirillaceae bacterium]|nr:Smr/MutS family protein [Rhodospirillaceae bacterium]